MFWNIVMVIRRGNTLFDIKSSKLFAKNTATINTKILSLNKSESLEISTHPSFASISFY